MEDTREFFDSYKDASDRGFQAGYNDGFADKLLKRKASLLHRPHNPYYSGYAKGYSEGQESGEYAQEN